MAEERATRERLVSIAIAASENIFRYCADGTATEPAFIPVPSYVFESQCRFLDKVKTPCNLNGNMPEDVQYILKPIPTG